LHKNIGTRKELSLMEKKIKAGSRVTTVLCSRVVPQGKEYQRSIPRDQMNPQIIEKILWGKLQEIFSTVLKILLEDMDQQIAEEWNKKTISAARLAKAPDRQPLW